MQPSEIKPGSFWMKFKDDWYELDSDGKPDWMQAARRAMEVMESPDRERFFTVYLKNGCRLSIRHSDYQYVSFQTGSVDGSPCE